MISIKHALLGKSIFFSVFNMKKHGYIVWIINYSVLLNYTSTYQIESIINIALLSFQFMFTYFKVMTGYQINYFLIFKENFQIEIFVYFL